MDYKNLLTRVEQTVSSIEMSDDDPGFVLRLAETIARNFRAEFGITGGRLYVARDSDFELTHRFGRANGREVGILVSSDYPPIREVMEAGAVVMDPDEPGVDKSLEKKLGAKRFAAIAVGACEYLVSFNIAPDSARDDVLFSLNIIRYAINQKIRAERHQSLISQARQIQESILPQRKPSFPGYDIFGRTEPFADVGGDFYDFIPISKHILGITIADATGHGLPAALVVRDIYMGLRMAADRDFKIIRSIHKLNNIINSSRLSSKFVSLFYGELESSGTFIFTNAGHNPPFLLRGRRTEWLPPNGPVLGAIPDADYTRGYVQFRQGDLLCLYSDGIVEATDTKGREFGMERMVREVRSHRNRGAQEICSRLLERASAWASGPQDDRTVVIVKAVGSSLLK